jgi:hypothetical protein
MNYLDMVLALQRECGVSGIIDTLANQTGETERLKQWIAQAWQQIQMKHSDWTWMRASNLLGSGVSFPTVMADYDYPLGTGPGTVGVLPENFHRWDQYSFRCSTTGYSFRDEMQLGLLTYDQWRNAYMIGAQRLVRTRPVVVAIAPDETVVLGPPPTDIYTITADYWRSPSAMLVDGDVPAGLPLQFHMLIVYLAMTYYAGYESAPEVLSRAQALYAPMMKRLERLRAVEIEMGAALA